MENKRFDSLTKAFASGQSRRSVLKGLLGFGGAAAVSTVIADETDARRGRGTRSTTTPPCQGEVCGTFCCEAPETCNQYGNGCCAEGTHACADSNATGCCADCGIGEFTCGYDCCESAEACCDAECCPSGEVCVANILDCSNDLCEERCCDDDQICDGRCCHGTCFWPFGSSTGDDDDDDGGSSYDRDCCPPNRLYCPATYDSSTGLCCDTGFECCPDANGNPVCIDPATQCCDASDCPGIAGQGEEACFQCVVNTCIAIPRGDQGDCADCYGCSGIQECVVNPQFNGDPCLDESGVCCDGACVTDGTQFYCEGTNACCITATESCCSGACCSGQCLRDNDPEFCCETDLSCVISEGPDQCCDDPANEKCCGDDGCCAGQCYNNDSSCCPKDSSFVPDGSDVCCLNAENYCSADGCCAGSCNDNGGCCEAPTTFACGVSCCDTATQKCCDGVCIDAGLCCESLGDCGDLTCCSGVCVDTTNDPDNCGSCDNGCPSDPDNCLASTCEAGSCSQSQSTCQPEQICDGSGKCCIDTNGNCTTSDDCCGLDYCDNDGICRVSA